MKPAKAAKLIRWVDSLEVSPPVVDLCRDFCDGVRLCRLVEHLSAKPFVGVNRKGLAKQACLSNIELALAVIWKQGARAAKMPSAQQLWQGQESAVFAVLQQCFEVFVLKKLRNRQQEALQWFFDLSASCSLPELQESKPWHAQFMSGIPVLCALHVTGIIPTLDEIFACPLSVIETRSNVMLLFSALLRADVPLYWTAEEYLSSQDSAFLLFQLVVIYEHLRECPLTIPKGAFRDAERIAQRIHQHELSEAKYQTQLVQAELNERNRQQARLEQLEQQRRVEDLITARSRRWQSDLHALKRLSSLVVCDVF